jgi:Ca-activated chloride channel family protein
MALDPDAREESRRYLRWVLLAGFSVIVALVGISYAALARLPEFLGATFEYPYFLLGLLLVPFVFWRGTVGEDARSVRLQLGTLRPLARGPLGTRVWLRDVPGIVRAVGLLLCVIALARPLNSLVPTSASDEGIDAVLVLDLSGSMRATVDPLPPELDRLAPRPSNQARPTRLDAAKAVMRDFISRRRTDRIGVVAFGSAAYVVSPPTLDYHVLDTLVARMQLDMIDGGGTAIGDAVGVASARLKQSTAESKAIILLTDGDNNSGSLDPEYAAHLATVVGARVYTIQIGTGEYAEVQQGFDLFGQPIYRKQRFPINPELLQTIAEKTNGHMYIASDAEGLKNSFHDVLDQLEKTKFEASVATFEELYRYLLVPGVLLIAFDALLRSLLLRRFP